MKILYIASDTPMTGGATKSFLAMLREVDKYGVSYEVVCPDEKGLTKHLREYGIKVHVVPYRHAILPLVNTIFDVVKWLPRLIHNYWLTAKAIRHVTTIAQNFSPDIIHENSSVLNVGYQVAKRLNLPDVIHIREYGDLDFNMKIPGIKRRLSSPFTYTISITKDILRHRNQETNPNAVQIYNGIIKSEQIRYQANKQDYLLFAGRIEPAKGITDLINAYISYALAIKNPLRLWIAGACNYPEYLKELKKKVADNGLEKMVRWIGETSNVDDLMYEASATIVPSRFEGLGRVLPEAMANGCLCIGRNTGGTKEQMDNGRKLTGKDIAFSFDNAEQLTHILISMTNRMSEGHSFIPNGEFYDMIHRSQYAVNEYFSEEKFGKRLMDFYRKIILDRQSQIPATKK